MSDNMRYYEKFYGIHANHGGVTFGTFTDHKKILVKDYISDGCLTTDYSLASATNEFLYINHIKKKYFIEGVIMGHITLAANTTTVAVTSFRVTLCKVNEDTSVAELFTTGWKVVNDTLTFADEVGEERVYYFEIDAWEKATLGEKDRLYIKIEVDADADTILMHSNDSEWEDVKMEIPFML